MCVEFMRTAQVIDTLIVCIMYQEAAANGCTELSRSAVTQRGRGDKSCSLPSLTPAHPLLNLPTFDRYSTYCGRYRRYRVINRPSLNIRSSPATNASADACSAVILSSCVYRVDVTSSVYAACGNWLHYWTGWRAFLASVSTAAASRFY